MLEELKDELFGANWITLEQAELTKAKNEIYCALFKLEFFLSTPINQNASCIINITAVDRYRLYVNGQPVCSGPCKGDRFNRYYETLDILHYLKEGENQILARVVVFPTRNSMTRATMNSYAPSMAHGPYSVMTAGTPPLLLLQGGLCCDGQELVSFSTDCVAWQSIFENGLEFNSCPPFYIANPFEKQIHKNKNWMNFKNENWPLALLYIFHQVPQYGENSPMLTKQRPIPLLYERKKSFLRQMPASNCIDIIKEGSLKIQAGQSISLVLDAGELTTSYVFFKTKGGDNASITFTYSESYWKDEHTKGKRDDWENGSIFGSSDQFYPAGADEFFQTFWFRSFRFIKIDICADVQSLEIWLPELLETAYPLEVKTTIKTDEQWVNNIWNCSLRTLQLCMHETHEDCPTYEQLQYVMDTRLQMLFTYVISGDLRMARRVLWDYHCSILPNGLTQSRYPSLVTQVIPTFSIYFIFMIEEYVWQSGDSSIINLYRASMDGILQYFENHIGSLGLVENLGFWDYCDWVKEWGDMRGIPHAADKGPATVHNLIYALGLQSAARINILCDRAEMSKEYLMRSEKINSAILKHCLDKDGLLKEGPDFLEYTQNSQILGVLSGLFDKMQAKAALEKCIKDESIYKCSFPWMFPLFRALEQCEMYNLTEKLLEPFKLIEEYALTTMPEEPDFEHSRSDCHAWSSLPLYEISRCWLGVRPSAIGWASILIKPLPCPLEELSGIVTTPKGDVFVSWSKKNEYFSITCETPIGVPVHIILPDGRQHKGNGGKFTL